jgi:hypothetical protein
LDAERSSRFCWQLQRVPLANLSNAFGFNIQSSSTRTDVKRASVSGYTVELTTIFLPRVRHEEVNRSRGEGCSLDRQEFDAADRRGVMSKAIVLQHVEAEGPVLVL